MPSSFSFNAYDIGLPTQHILFRQGDDAPVRVEIPGVSIPEDREKKFQFLYKKLVESGLIDNTIPVFRG